MTTETESPTATGIATPDTNRETYIGWNLDDGRNQPTAGWNEKTASKFRMADSLYLRFDKNYQHLDQTDAGLKNGPAWWNQAYLNEWSNKDLIEILTDNLELLPRQAKRAKRYFLSQNLSKWGIRKELVAWSVCAYVLHSDEQDCRRSHPQATTGKRAYQFWDIADSLNLSPSERISTYSKVQTDMTTPGYKYGKEDRREGGGI